MTRCNDLILLVDDSREESEITRSLLIRSGYRVHTASSSKEALESIRMSIPSLVMLNDALPDGNGNDICRAIREIASQNGLHIPVLLLAELHKLGDKMDGLDYCADDFIAKPPIPQELAARVRSLIRTRDLQERLHESNQRLEEAHRMIEREMNRIGEMQRSFLPQELPTHPNVELAAFYHPSAEAGGDYYDVIPLDQNRWAIVMADIAGHGASAAVVMAITQLVVKDIAPESSTPEEALLKINDKLLSHLKSHQFVTMFYAILSLNERELTYASAGHNPMLYYSGADGAARLLETEPSYPLCTFTTDGYKESRRRFDPGDRVLLYTDGVLDVLSSDKEFYGLDRLTAEFLAHRLQSPQEIVCAIFRDTEEFRGDMDRVDDFTLMAASFL